MGFGDYPAEYDPKIHGVFDPARYYGKVDTPFSKVKLGELGEWFGRRNKSPQAFMGLCSRAWWRWTHKYINPRKGSSAPFYQLAFAFMALGYWINYGKIKHHKQYRFH